MERAAGTARSPGTARCAALGRRQSLSAWRPLEHPWHEPKRKRRWRASCLAHMQEGCVVGVWSAEQSAGCRERDDGWRLAALPAPMSHVALRQKRTERQCLWPSHMERLQKLQLCECCERDNESLPVPKGLPGPPSTVGWVGPSARLPWSPGLRSTTGLFQNVQCWVAVK